MSRRRSHSFCALLLLFLAACSPAPNVPDAGIEAASDQEPSSTQSPERKFLRELVWNQEFDRLENIANAARQNEKAEGEQYFTLIDFYDFTGAIGKSNPESAWDYHLEHLKLWRNAKADSVAPRIATAHYWERYAWKARGSGYASKVSDDAFRTFYTRLKEAKKELDAVPAEKRTDPHYYNTLLSIGIGLGMEKEEAIETFHEGLKHGRYYLPLYDNIVCYLLPRWYGEPGDIGRFAKETRAYMGRDGDWAFVKIVWMAYNYEGDEFFDRTKIRYADVKEIFERWTADPKNLEDANYLCLYACLAGDSETARAMFQRIGNNWDKECWYKEGRFLAFRKKYAGE